MSNSPLESLKEPSRIEIWKMFDTLSATYDKTNRWMTFGLDLYWRKKMSSYLPSLDKISLLDCATGTADQIISLVKHSSKIEEAIGIDLSEEMINIGRQKVQKTPFAKKISLEIASALEIPFPEKRFDCVTLSFGIRNVTDVSLSLGELLRVLKPGGKALILETSLPRCRILRFFHVLYIRKILPIIGGLISKKKHAYQYLNQTAETFPHGKDFCSLLEKAGFTKVAC
ncbi:MAG: bifunctional demethylmenaquinone methyltransferase/2-methoxy-6-polyprenyl-1,4-benzoquinol methylase UbiE, partial [Verrucomicrobia bacterium]|nr:bifunctional demethylmenaquinone methyltransferase/2-methoxy-6-polyprenyl-1,4-benzoquinol methylase UbiE [Verrucomicrobiota bacterium]